MNARVSITAFVLVLTTIIATGAQEYELGWEQVNKSVAPAEKTYTLDWESVSQRVDRALPQTTEEVEPPEAPERGEVAMMGPLKDMAPPPLYLKKKAAPKSYDIQLSASQYYDHYKQRYLKVKFVEVETVRNGRSFCETFENRGAWNSYPVFLNDLEDGDQYAVRVIWDDGSNRTIEKTVNSYTAGNIFIDQPDYLAYSAW